jgi:hypothetical protein
MDAVWKSKAIITDFGWAVEIRIPCSLQVLNEKTKMGHFLR